MSHLDLYALRPWPGVRWAGLPEAEAAADAGPAAPPSGTALIQMRLNSAVPCGPRPKLSEPNREMGHRCTGISRSLPCVTTTDIACRLPVDRFVDRRFS
jgi:hypothetical protein